MRLAAMLVLATVFFTSESLKETREAAARLANRLLTYCERNRQECDDAEVYARDVGEKAAAWGAFLVATAGEGLERIDVDRLFADFGAQVDRGTLRQSDLEPTWRGLEAATADAEARH